MRTKLFYLTISLLVCFYTKGQIMSSVAGNGLGGFTGDGGSATAAALNNPYGICYNASGNLFIADFVNNRVRKISTSGIITTVAGSAASGFTGDGGPATSATMSGPVAVACDAAGNLYIADKNNHRIRMVNSSGIINTVAGNGSAVFAGDGGPATAGSLNSPSALTFDASGNLYIADLNNNRIRMVNTAGVISTIAGTGSATYSGDGAAATLAGLNNPAALAFDLSGKLYIADKGNNRIRVINTSGIISTIAGNGTSGFSGDGGSATAAQLLSPEGITVSSSGTVYFSDRNNQRIRKVTSAGIISTFAGNGTGSYAGDGAAATSASLNNPVGLAIDGAGNLRIGDCNNNRVRNVPTIATATLCPSSIPLAGIDTLGVNTFSSGSTIACNASPFYVFANYGTGGIVDSISSLFSPTLQLDFNTYQSSLGTNGKVSFYENGTYLSCLGPTVPCAISIGGGTALSGSRWTLYKCHNMNGSKAHDIVFSTTGAITTTTVNIKSAWTNQIFNSFVWSASGVSSQTVTIPASTNIGSCSFSIAPTVTNTAAFNDLGNGNCYVNPQLLALGTYTVTYTFSDTVCTNQFSNYTFSVGLPIVNWTAPKPCLPGPCITLTVNTGSQTTGTWSGSGVSGTSFCPSVLGNTNITYAVGTGTCSATQTHTLIVNATPTVTVNSASYCSGKSVLLSAAGATTYIWAPSTALSNTISANVTANPATSTTYTVYGTSNSCSSVALSTVTVHPLPVAGFTANPQPAFITNPAISFTDQTTNATLTNWSWTFGDGHFSSNQNPSNTFSNIGTYNVELLVTSNFGCRDSITKPIEIKADAIVIYNSFSPNGDGLNDIFEIDNIDAFGPNHVYIYNRWGQLLWDKSGYDNKTVVWEGKDNKGTVLPPATYFYIIEVDGKSTEKHWVELTK
jgi:gliding motility-associated-like protein